MIDVKKIREDFPMIKNKPMMQGKPLVFLDNASTTFKPQQVIDACLEYDTKMTSNSHRGDYDLCFNVDQRIDETREVVAKFINSDKNEVVFTSGTSMSINMIAYGYGCKYLTKEDEILITEAEHASNVLPWYKVSNITGCKVNFIPLDEKGRLTASNLRKVISNKTKIVAVAHVSNVLGYCCDVKELSKIAHEFGALLVLDGAQSVPHQKCDVKELDIDFLSFSGHKMCGPTGIGVLYGKKELLEKMDPLMSGGGMNSTFDTCGDVQYLEAPAKFEAGTLNISGIFGLKAAIEYINSIGIDNIHEYEKELRAYLIKELKKNEDVIIYNEDAEAGIVTFNLKNVFAQDEATYLNSKGIAVRSGQHCAKILVEFLKTFATIRCSIYFYTSKEDIDALVNALKEGDFLDAYFA